MNIDRFKTQHVEILSGISALRELAHQGIESHAVDMAHELKALSRVITTHLAIEDRILYPSILRNGDLRLARMAREYQDDMKGIANAFIAFARRWGSATALARDPEGFRKDANSVLKDVHARMMRENREFYPEIEAL